MNKNSPTILKLQRLIEDLHKDTPLVTDGRKVDLVIEQCRTLIHTVDINKADEILITNNNILIQYFYNMVQNSQPEVKVSINNKRDLATCKRMLSSISQVYDITDKKLIYKYAKEIINTVIENYKDFNFSPFMSGSFIMFDTGDSTYWVTEKAFAIMNDIEKNEDKLSAAADKAADTHAEKMLEEDPDFFGMPGLEELAENVKEN